MSGGSRGHDYMTGYHGEGLDPTVFLKRLAKTARARGWEPEFLGPVDGEYIHAYRRYPADARVRVYLSAGIHGDEPAGPLALERLIEDDRIPRRVACCVCPCLNPWGMKTKVRENRNGYDLNRDYLSRFQPETNLHIQWLERQSLFDVGVCLHEDWETKGFYFYELDRTGRASLAKSILDAVRPICPVEQAEVIEGRPAESGVIRPIEDPETRRHWPEAIYLLANKTRLTYTLETPSCLPLEQRVTTHVAAVNEIFRQITMVLG